MFKILETDFLSLNTLILDFNVVKLRAKLIREVKTRP